MKGSIWQPVILLTKLRSWPTASPLTSPALNAAATPWLTGSWWLNSPIQLKNMRSRQNGFILPQGSGWTFFQNIWNHHLSGIHWSPVFTSRIFQLCWKNPRRHELRNFSPNPLNLQNTTLILRNFWKTSGAFQVHIPPAPSKISQQLSRSCLKPSINASETPQTPAKEPRSCRRSGYRTPGPPQNL